MEFWGAEVKSGESFLVEPEDDWILRLSQACLGEVEKDKGGEPVHLFAKVKDKKFVIGILSSEKFPQTTFDLVFEREFELSHNSKSGSVYFTGYKAPTQTEDGSDGLDDSDSEDEMVPIPIDHGGSSLQVKPEKKSEGVNKDVKSDKRVTTGNEKDSSSEDKASDDKPKVRNEEESSEDDSKSDDQEESEHEETNGSEEEDSKNKLKVGISKKRPAQVAKTTSGGDKKAKFQTPEKAVAKPGGSKVGGHTATPHPAKQAGKTAAKNDQPKQQTSKSGGAFPCKSCNRSFGSDIALQSHTKAKHAT